MQLGHINQLARCSIGFGRVETNCTFKANGFHNEFGKLAYGEFLACSYIDVTIANLA